MTKQLPDGQSKRPPFEINLLLSPLSLTLLTALAAMFLMPRRSAFSFDFQTGQVWTYRTLKAPFDFEVLRPESEVRDELAHVEAQHGRYYLLNPEVARAQKRRFAQLLDEQTRISQNDSQYADIIANSGAYLSYGQGLLDHLYGRGIVQADDDLRDTDPEAMVWLVTGKEERRVPARSLLKPKTARDFLTDSLPFSPLRQPEFLLPILEKTIAPNVRYSDSLTLAGKRRKIAAVVSTGITVRRGEKIIEANEIVGPEAAQKLHSLARRYEEPKGLGALLGYGLLSLLVFGAFFLWLRQEAPEIWLRREKLLLLLVAILLPIALTTLGSRVGAAIPLLLPLCALPLFLGRVFDLKIGLSTWALPVFLTTFALDWGLGWLSIQVVGGLAALIFFAKTKTWRGRVAAAALTSGAMILAWLAAFLAGRLPDSVMLADVPLFLLVAGFLTLATFPVGGFWIKNFEKIDSNLPVKS